MAVGLLLTDFFHEMQLCLQPPSVSTSSRMESFQSSEQSPQFERLCFHSLGIEALWKKLFGTSCSNALQLLSRVLHRISAAAESLCSLLCKRQKAFYLRGSATKLRRGRFLFLQHFDCQVNVLLLDWVFCV